MVSAPSAWVRTLFYDLLDARLIQGLGAAGRPAAQARRRPGQGRFGEDCSCSEPKPGQRQEALDDQRVADIDQEGADDRHQQEGHGRDAVATGHRLHVGDGGRRGAELEAALAGGDDRRIVVAPHHLEGQEHHQKHGQHGLSGEDDQDRQGQIDQLPEAQRHQGHGQEQ